jgi:hypothetical protein|tara:strand:+ start:22953 stop:23273 length:321 start_codon:yes stop_codon:yes gene_type:complete
MGKRNNLKNVLKFCDLLSQELTLRFGDYPTIKDIILHLSQNGTIKPVTLRNYLIIQDFYSKLKDNNGKMNITFMDISIEYNLSERQIQTIIYEYQKKLQPRNNICR